MQNYIGPQCFGGVPVTITPSVKCEKKVKRTWRERLFSFPLLKKYKIEYEFKETIEDGQVLRTDKGLFMNETTWHKYRLELTQRSLT